MPNLPLVILHGWSDSFESFKPLGTLLKDAGIAEQVTDIHLGNYVTMDDHVEFHDIVEAMMRAWKDKQLPMTPRSTNMVVHSTGGLVVRDWLDTHFAPGQCPIHHLLMLAPANFGSPLAHQGHSFLGRLFKGLKSDKPFQTGERILKGLELASPYSTSLALRDLFAEKTKFEAGKILCTVLVGNTGYSGFRSIANRDGSDGTVYVSTANLQTANLILNYAENPEQPQWQLRPCTCQTGFGVMDGENHGSIIGEDERFNNDSTFLWIKDALTVNDDRFEGFTTRLAVLTDSVMARYLDDDSKHGFQNTVFRLRDQYHRAVPDYFLQFYEHDTDSNRFAEQFHREVLCKVHPYEEDKSYRSIFMDCTQLHDRIDKPEDHVDIRLYASPEITKEGNVGYRTFVPGDLGSIKIQANQIKDVFRANRTLLTEMTIRRYQSKQVFEFKGLNDKN
ncbi:MAG: hypothetical protein KKE73_02440 [Proteobacteria bacterium]|nr:hypothetical protein [Pseudomonadota bacterium]